MCSLVGCMPHGCVLLKHRARDDIIARRIPFLSNTVRQSDRILIYLIVCVMDEYSYILPIWGHWPLRAAVVLG